jgi:hypothetical protein
MPKTEGRPDALGIRYEGEVLNGSMSVNDAFAREKQAQQLHAVQTTLRTGVRTYVSPEDYEPLLLLHTMGLSGTASSGAFLGIRSRAA